MNLIKVLSEMMSLIDTSTVESEEGVHTINQKLVTDSRIYL